MLWEPGAWSASRLGRLASGLGDFASYEEFRVWTLEHLDAWWLAVWRECGLPVTAGSAEPSVALADASLPGAVWFPGVTTNYAQAMLALPGRADDDVVVVSHSQSREEVSWTSLALRADVARVRAGLVSLGVGRGDRVAAYAPNIGETLVFLLAAASLGAVFCSVAPEFGTQSVVDRLGQLEPSVLLAVDGYRYGDKPVSRAAEVSEVLAAVPSVRAVVHLPYLDAASSGPQGAVPWSELGSADAELEFEPVPFDHPLYVLFSSGTTGLPKPIVHGHGGIMLGHASAIGLFTDLGPTDRFSWFSTTGWMMWNYLVSGLLVGSTVVLFDGNPAWPSLMSQWELVASAGLTYYGTSAPFLMTCRKEGLTPAADVDLARLRGLGSTGAPLPAEGFAWVDEAVRPAGGRLQIGSLSGGTDVCNGFVGATPLTPVWEGEISARLPGIAVEAFVEPAPGSGQWRAAVGEVGELVITAPMPSMPVGFWGDDDGSRYRAAYFEDIPGVWRHGDWVRITERGSLVITGRSDATLNRGGVRLGTAEFYRVVEELPEVKDSLVVHLESDAGDAGELVLLVSLTDVGTALAADELRSLVAGRLRSRLSPRHVPDTLHVVRALPRTLSGKKLEVPVKKILRGADPADVASAGALDDPRALAELAALADPEAHAPLG
ncbi:acetoacetate--CoA ligase [Nocardioides sp. CBS4Y-1]|uniref:Acetoacetate--CoA ligase n=1 Tax=Nocardioides acrostichi TaxID=2784339 RepID=A0A930V6C3_9ACTN|nr:acetoacetate--CoA ligase [Nocardioides acrostichi]